MSVKSVRVPVEVGQLTISRSFGVVLGRGKEEMKSVIVVLSATG